MMEKNAKKLQGRKYLLTLVNKFTEGFPNHRPNQGFTALAARMNNRWRVKKKFFLKWSSRTPDQSMAISGGWDLELSIFQNSPSESTVQLCLRTTWCQVI